MKEFNLSLWLKDKSRKIITRDGRPVRILDYNLKGDKPICIAVDDKTQESITTVDEDGHCLRDKTVWHESNFDLFFADEKDELTEFEIHGGKLMDYKQKFKIGDIVKGKRTFNGEVIEGKFNGFSLYNKLNPQSVVGVIDTYERFYDVSVDSIELVENKDEKIRKAQLDYWRSVGGKEWHGVPVQETIAWLEKQGGITKLSEEEQNKFAKGVLTSYALSFINYLDSHKYEGKMCVSNGECEDIEDAFHNAMWDKLHRYYCKYIERQGKQKLTDKVEPKFHEGEWVVQGCNILKIRCVGDEYYCFETVGGYVDDMLVSEIDSLYHLWTIQDAKDGDVLAYVTDEEDLWIMIYRSLYEPYEGHVHYHALLVNDNFSDKGTCCICINDLKPATKEQCDLLFQKMKEAGYTWDAEKKELKKIEQNHAWSEDDEEMRLDTIKAFQLAYPYATEEENPRKRNIDWLKSLKPHWKPTEEQMDALYYAMDFVTSLKHSEILESLYNALKSL